MIEPDSTAEGLAQPPIKRFCQTRAVACLGHLGAAAQRMAGAIDRFRQQMRTGVTARFNNELLHRDDMGISFAQIDLAQGAIFPLGFPLFGRLFDLRFRFQSLLQ